MNVKILLLGSFLGASSFQIPVLKPFPRRTECALKQSAWGGENRQELTATDKVWNLHRYAPEPTEYDETVMSIFPGAISNKDLETRVVQALAERGFRDANTLLATSLCSDEVARRLEADFVEIYGSNFNLGGLSGFPFAGNIGFENMALHIPDDGSCFIVYGPHVGVSRTGAVGKVERSGVRQVENCCTSAIAACNHLLVTGEGWEDNTGFTDLQQGAVERLIAPQIDRLTNARDPMVELPFALFESQEQLLYEIIQAGSGKVKNNIALLGGIQINTAPEALDYFVPLRFYYMNNRGEVIEDLLNTIA